MIKSHINPAHLLAATLCQQLLNIEELTASRAGLLYLLLGYINIENNTHFKLREMVALSELCSPSYNNLTGPEVGLSARAAYQCKALGLIYLQHFLKESLSQAASFQAAEGPSSCGRYTPGD